MTPPLLRYLDSDRGYREPNLGMLKGEAVGPEATSSLRMPWRLWPPANLVVGRSG
jgi:hypothetical protein